MAEKCKGGFSVGLYSLQLQLKGLLDGAGGDDAIALLDAVGTLSNSEQKTALAMFRRVVERLSTEENRILTAEEVTLKDFEETLYRDILDSMQAASGAPAVGPIAKKLEVLNGGKTRARRRGNPIDLAEARARRGKVSLTQ